MGNRKQGWVKCGCNSSKSMGVISPDRATTPGQEVERVRKCPCLDRQGREGKSTFASREGRVVSDFRFSTAVEILFAFT
jgi:hypothetical protein